MNTPAHAIVNLIALAQREKPKLVLPVLLGAVLPDLPMVLFYVYQKSLGRSELQIWSSAYYEPAWQALFDLFNSVPLIVVGWLICHLWEKLRGKALFSSLGLHALCDFALHHDDAHRHFYPLFNWRFESPVSYWDPRHYGQYFSIFEIAVVVLGCVYLSWAHRSRLARGTVICVATVYVLYLAYVLVVWV